MKTMTIVYQLVHRDYDAVNVEFHSVGQLEKFLRDNDRLAHAIGFSGDCTTRETGEVSGKLFVISTRQGSFTSKQFRNYKELTEYLQLESGSDSN